MNESVSTSSFHFVSSEYPQSPGVYLMKDDQGRIIYVGKAKSLRKRLASYFRPAETLTPKTRILVQKINSIDYLLTDTEKEALLLEISLIKKHRPRYNIVLRDDKSPLLFKLDKTSEFPRLSLTRKVVRDGSVYFGPFISAQNARSAWKSLQKIFPLRKCKDKSFKNRVRPCLYHHLGHCPAPCCNMVSREDYAMIVKQTEAFLSGKSKELITNLKKEMLKLADDLEFERAAILRNRIACLSEVTEKQSVTLNDDSETDVLGHARIDGGISLALLFVRNGRLIDRQTFFWQNLDDSEIPELIHSFITQYYLPGRIIPELILLPDISGPVDPRLEEALGDLRGSKVRIRHARMEVEKNLIETAMLNAREAPEKTSSSAIEPVLKQTAEALGLPEMPIRIECVDVTHLSGQGTRAGLVVFENGKPKSSDYRLYAFEDGRIGGDDYLALREFIVRRIGSGPPWPDLLLIDGGKGQLASVERGLKEIANPPPIRLAAIAKPPGRGRFRRSGEQESIFLPGRINPLNLSSSEAVMLFLIRIRDEAHRFVAQSGRKAMRKKTLRSELAELPGIGLKTSRLLWDEFKTMEGILGAGINALSAIPGVGSKKALRIRQALDVLMAAKTDK